jgi:polysaccharide biosynthesis protein PelD
MKEKESFFLGIRVSAWVEIACFFFFSYIIAFLIGSNYNYFAVSPHPFWIVVIFVSAQYGTLAGLLAAFVSTLVYLSGGPLPKQNILQEGSEYFFLIAKLPLLWFVSALILGELRMKHIRERDHLRVLAYETIEREKKLAESYEGLKRLKERLELRVSSEMPTALVIVDAFKKLEEANKKEINERAGDLTKILIGPEKFSIFLLDSQKLKSVDTVGWRPEDHYANSFEQTNPLFQEIVDKKRVVSLTTSDSDILGREGVLAAPIQSSPLSPVIGMIKIEQIPFPRVTLTTLESLRLIGNAIGKAYEH